MKIVFVARRLVRAGAERQLVTLATGLADAGHEVVVATFRPGELDDDVESSRARLVPLGAPTRWTVPRACLRLVRLARAMRPDIVHGYLDAPNLLSSVVARAARPARAVWALQASAMEKADMMRLTRMLYWVEPRVASTAALVVCNSAAGRRDAIARGFPAARLCVIPQGVDTERFHNDARAGQEFRAELGLAPATIVLGRVGRLHPMKDYERFIDAVAGLLQRGLPAHAICMGEGDEHYTAELRARAREKGVDDSMTWCAPVDDIERVYSGLDVLVSSSRYGEGHPTVVAEAMACEVPCVVTDVGDSADLVGDTGAVVPPGDTDALVERIFRLAATTPTERAELGRRARARIVDAFAVDTLVVRTLAALRVAVGEPEPA